MSRINTWNNMCFKLDLRKNESRESSSIWWKTYLYYNRFIATLSGKSLFKKGVQIQHFVLMKLNTYVYVT